MRNTQNPINTFSRTQPPAVGQSDCVAKNTKSKLLRRYALRNNLPFLQKAPHLSPLPQGERRLIIHSKSFFQQIKVLSCFAFPLSRLETFHILGGMKIEPATPPAVGQSPSKQYLT
jgi:hypothetical protein